jgi:hypothetical protein
MIIIANLSELVAAETCAVLVEFFHPALQLFNFVLKIPFLL